VPEQGGDGGACPSCPGGSRATGARMRFLSNGIFEKVRSMNIVKFISAIKVSSNVRICRRLFCRVYLTLSAMKFSIVTELYRNFLYVFTFSHISAANFLENTFVVEAKQIQQTIVIGCGQ